MDDDAIKPFEELNNPTRQDFMNQAAQWLLLKPETYRRY
jgi:hypothetical protein